MEKLYKRTFWCWLGIHRWYIGCFSSPVWGRAERHCLDCDKRQYLLYVVGKKKRWFTFKFSDS